MELPEEWMASEKGNTWLSDEDGNHMAWFRVNGRFLEVSVTPENSPGFWVRVLPDEDTTEKIAKHINDNLSGWTVVRCQLGGLKIVEGKVA